MREFRDATPAEAIRYGALHGSVYYRVVLDDAGNIIEEIPAVPVAACPCACPCGGSGKGGDGCSCDPPFGRTRKTPPVP